MRYPFLLNQKAIVLTPSGPDGVVLCFYSGCMLASAPGMCNPDASSPSVDGQPRETAIQGDLRSQPQHDHDALKAGIGFAELSNGFADTDDPAALQAICDRLGPGTINVFFQRWLARLPLPLTPHDRDAGYWWELSMAQIEVSRTLVLTQPRYARGFFEALVADNLDL